MIKPSYFACKLAESLSNHGAKALPLAQVYEKFAQNKDRAWFEREVRKIKEKANV